MKIYNFIEYKLHFFSPEYDPHPCLLSTSFGSYLTVSYFVTTSGNVSTLHTSPDNTKDGNTETHSEKIRSRRRQVCATFHTDLKAKAGGRLKGENPQQDPKQHNTGGRTCGHTNFRSAN